MKHLKSLFLLDEVKNQFLRTILRVWLSTFWRELPELDHPMIVGEDMHFSVMLQKYIGLNTYVTPHPKDNKELWGS